MFLWGWRNGRELWKDVCKFNIFYLVYLHYISTVWVPYNRRSFSLFFLFVETIHAGLFPRDWLFEYDSRVSILGACSSCSAVWTRFVMIWKISFASASGIETILTNVDGILSFTFDSIKVISFLIFSKELFLEKHSLESAFQIKISF